MNTPQALETSTPLHPAHKHPNRGGTADKDASAAESGWSSAATAYQTLPGQAAVRRGAVPAQHPGFYSGGEFSAPADAVAPGRVSRLFWDPRTPYVLSLYLQLFFNIVIVTSVLVLLYRFVTTIHADVLGKMDSYTSDAVREISRCSREFFRNKCSSENRAPALESACTVWEKCMNRDPQQIGRSQITAETFAEIVDGFLRPISWKALVFFTLLTLGSLFATNFGFRSLRRSTHGDCVAWREEQSAAAACDHARDHACDHARSQPVLAASTPFVPPARFLDSSVFANDSPLSGKDRR